MRKPMGAVLLAFVPLFFSTLVSAQGDLPISDPVVNGGPRSIHYSRIGMERYEDGKKAPHQFEIWRLGFAENRPDACSMLRTVFYDHMRRGRRYTVSEYSHKCEDGTLTLVSADWQAGKLEFTIRHHFEGEYQQTDCVLRFGVRGSTIFLEDLSGVRSKRPNDSGPETIEYRVAPLTEIRMIPIEINGLVSEFEKAMRDMEETLASQDREIWQNHRKEVPILSLQQQASERAVPGYPKTLTGPLSVAQAEKVREFFASELQVWLAGKGVSPDGQERIGRVYRRHLLPEF